MNYDERDVLNLFKEHQALDGALLAGIMSARFNKVSTPKPREVTSARKILDGMINKGLLYKDKAGWIRPTGIGMLKSYSLTKDGLLDGLIELVKHKLTIGLTEKTIGAVCLELFNEVCDPGEERLNVLVRDLIDCAAILPGLDYILSNFENLPTVEKRIYDVLRDFEKSFEDTSAEIRSIIEKRKS